MAAPPKKGSTLGGYLLGLVPLGAGIVLGTLCLPHDAPPDDVPVPIPDVHVLAQVRAADHARAQKPLPDDVRALGSALRTFQSREAQQGVDPYVTPTTMNEARMAIDQVLGPLLLAKNDDVLLSLRASQLEGFLAEMHAFESKGTSSPELEALGGAFVRRATDVGWCHGAACAMDDDVLRVMFKLAWDTLVRVDRLSAFEPTLDEERVLYAFYLRHPHVPESVRKRIDEAAVAARTPKACHALAEGGALAAEEWRWEKVRRIAQVDPEYPGAYAIGVTQFRRKNYPAAAESFRDWLDAHPDGAWTLRARSFLRASVERATID